MRQNFNHEKFEKDCKLDENNLAKEMSEVSSLLGYYGAQAALWQSVLDNFKLQIEARTAEIALDAKAADAKTSVAVMEAMAATDAEVSKLRRAELKAKEEVSLYKIAIEAMDKKGSMASSIGATKRAELSNLSPGYYSGGPVTDHTTPVAGFPSYGTPRIARPAPAMPTISAETKAEIMAMLSKKPTAPSTTKLDL